MEKIIAVIGDVHGCFDALVKLYEKIVKLTTEVYTVGDLIDRGPDSMKVIEFCIQKDIKSVMGNHESMLLKTIESPRYRAIPGYITNLTEWRINGGGFTIKSYLGDDEISFKKFSAKFIECGHFDYIAEFPFLIELQNCIITHGGILSDKPLQNVLWNRETPSKLSKLQVFGHTPYKEVIHIPNHFINVDTGCVFGGQLSCAVINLSTGKVIVLD